jgi:hypothetical protein
VTGPFSSRRFSRIHAEVTLLLQVEALLFGPDIVVTFAQAQVTAEPGQPVCRHQIVPAQGPAIDAAVAAASSRLLQPGARIEVGDKADDHGCADEIPKQLLMFTNMARHDDNPG